MTMLIEEGGRKVGGGLAEPNGKIAVRSGVRRRNNR